MCYLSAGLSFVISLGLRSFAYFGQNTGLWRGSQEQGLPSLETGHTGAPFLSRYLYVIFLVGCRPDEICICMSITNQYLHAVKMALTVCLCQMPAKCPSINNLC